jgi:hypothetical protein
MKKILLATDNSEQAEKVVRGAKVPVNVIS